MKSPFSLLRSRRFLPLFVTQLLGAVNDNLYKNALVVLVLFRAGAGSAELVALAGGVFILPYAFLSATAGQLADKLEKARLIRLTKLGEVGIMLLAAVGFYTDNVAVLMAVLFGLGIQATFFGPLKYGILPTHLATDELVGGNGLIEGGTFLGILAGTIAGGALILLPHGATIVSAAGIAVALAGLAASFAVPPSQAAVPDLAIGANVVAETIGLVRDARTNRPVWLALLGISWFWVVGATLLAEFPTLARDDLHADGHVVTLMLAFFSIGIGAGSIICARLLKGEVTARYVPFAAIGISVFVLDFAHAGRIAGTLANVAAMLSTFAGWRVLLDLSLLAVCGGIYSVPLYAIMQERSPAARRSRTIAANNVVNAAAMVIAAIVAAGLTAAGLSAPAILTITGAANFLVAIWIVRLLPEETVRAVFRWYFATLHGVSIKGLENLPPEGARTVIVANHVSFLDGCFLAAFLPGAPVFAVNTEITRTWWARPFLAAVRNFPVDIASPFATRNMIRAVQQGDTMVIFPEGRITKTGALMKVYEGAGMVADHAGAALVPIRIEGLQFSKFSRTRGKLRQRWFPRLSLTMLPAIHLEVDPELHGRRRRQVVGTVLQDIMVKSDFFSRDTDRALFAALLDAAGRFGRHAAIVEDIARAPMSYTRLIAASAVLGRKLTAHAGAGETIGVLLPNATAALITLFGLQAFGRVPALLNATAGAQAMLAACHAAGVRTLLTSRAFVARAKLTLVVERLETELRIVWLEDIRKTVGTFARLRGWFDSQRAHRLPGARLSADIPAVILFTSGSEGTPKGVALSHRNLLANCAQLAAVVDFNSADRVFNAMPMFHAFGLTGGTLLPLMSGVRTFLYPSPLHYRIVPALIYDTDSTIAFGTDTFLAGWARFAHPYDFYAMRYIFAGAERLRDETRRTYAERFGVRVLEGYGATETAPVLSLNTAMHSRSGSAGRLLPGIVPRLEPVPGITAGGRLAVSGPNVMLGYYRSDDPGRLQPLEGGAYDTGDIVEIDEDGFVFIKGRAKRFAKIAGEMVSMTAAEALAAGLWPDAAHAVVSRPDSHKGEQLVLLTTKPDATTAALLAHARAHGTTEIAVPRIIQVVDTIPLLGTGKTDYQTVARMVETRAAA